MIEPVNGSRLPGLLELTVQLIEHGTAAIESIDGDVGQFPERRQPRLAHWNDLIVVRDFRLAIELRFADGEERVVLAAEIPAVRAGPTNAGVHRTLAPTGVARQADGTR